MSVSFAKKTMDTIMERFLHICGLIGTTGKSSGKKEEARQLSLELRSGETTLDNRLYEEFGMSGEDMAEVLFG